MKKIITAIILVLFMFAMTTTLVSCGDDELTPEYGFSMLEELDDEEIQILRLVCENKSRKEIANELFLSEGTVKRRISGILAKTGYDSIMKLAVHAVSDGYIVPKLK